MSHNKLWGIDLGGTKIEAVVLDASNNTILYRERVPTCSEEGYDKVISQILKVIDIVKEKSGLEPKSLGIGTPGRLDRSSQTIKNSNSTPTC